jgi:acyl-CoA synthetase (NDP forming)
MKQIQKLEHLFMPRSIAVIGASDTDGKVGNVIARNLISYAYDGEVFFVNPHREKILERRCYPSVLSIGQ